MRLFVRGGARKPPGAVQDPGVPRVVGRDTGRSPPGVAGTPGPRSYRGRNGSGSTAPPASGGVCATFNTIEMAVK